jgi:hypothetical protein
MEEYMKLYKGWYITQSGKKIKFCQGFKNDKEFKSFLEDLAVVRYDYKVEEYKKKVIDEPVWF